MFTGYNFFDYKYNIPGYSGQDYDGPGRIIYLVASMFLIVLLCSIFRKAKHEHIRTYLRVVGFFLLAINIVKFVWETYWDVTTGQGFNMYILPLDTCSFIVSSALMAGFGKGKVKLAGEAWLATIGIAGGISNLLFLQALRYYPFFTFGAFHSMIWHFLMVFTGMLLLVTHYVEFSFKAVLHGFVLHMLYSIPVIIFDYAMNYDFMLYHDAGGIPMVEKLAETLNMNGFYWATTLMMILIYFGITCLFIYLAKGCSLITYRVVHRKPQAYKTINDNNEAVRK